VSSTETARALLLELYEAAVAAAAPAAATARAIDALELGRARRVWLFAIGKAARPMAAAAVRSLQRGLHSIIGGVVVAPDDAPPPYPTLASMRGDHPVPGRHSFEAAVKIGEIAAGRRSDDIAIVLLSGGASALIGAPVRGIAETDFVSLHDMLLGSGLDIAEMNSVRKRFSRWSAGRLALALAPAATYCLAISDVAGDDMSVIGSGPCVPDTTTAKEVRERLERAGLFERIPQAMRDYLGGVSRGTTPETPSGAHPAFAHITARVIGNNRIALDGVAASARDHGFESRILPTRLDGEASAAGEAVARTLIASRAASSARGIVVWGGETTVKLGAKIGSAAGGGRCQELALAAARVLHDADSAADGITLLAAGTDGRDGATEAAGAVVDSTTWNAVAAAGRDPSRSLAAHESHGALAAANALIPRRDTGTNVNDVVIGLV
jgi:hydroxypyruvate reductase